MQADTEKKSSLTAYCYFHVPFIIHVYNSNFKVFKNLSCGSTAGIKRTKERRQDHNKKLYLKATSPFVNY
jgi:hypothetical protein